MKSPKEKCFVVSQQKEDSAPRFLILSSDLYVKLNKNVISACNSLIMLKNISILIPTETLVIETAL